MLLTAGDRNTRRETCISATFSTKHLAWTVLGSNRAFAVETGAPKKKINVRYTNFQFAPQLV